MTDRYHAWLTLIAQRDQVYLQLLLIVGVAYLNYRLWAKPFLRVIKFLATLLVWGGLAWGVWWIAQ